MRSSECMTEVREHGTKGEAEPAGAISRMFDRMVVAGLVSKPPYVPTARGMQVLDEWRAQHGNSEANR